MATDATHTDNNPITSPNPNPNPIQIQNPSHSPSHSQGSSTNPPPPTLSPLKEGVPKPSGAKEEEVEDTAMDTGASARPQMDDKPPIHDGFHYFTSEEISKYQKYEADYACRLRAKYFSNKDIYGGVGEIFDLTVNIDGEIIKASRWSPTRSFADPKQGFVDRDKDSAAAASRSETRPNVQNGNITPQKKSYS